MKDNLETITSEKITEFSASNRPLPKDLASVLLVQNTIKLLLENPVDQTADINVKNNSVCNKGNKYLKKGFPNYPIGAPLSSEGFKKRK